MKEVVADRYSCNFNKKLRYSINDMSFIKKLSRGGHYLGKQLSHGLRSADKALHVASGLIHRSHTGYRTVKRFASHTIPGAGLGFALLEASPEGMAVDAGRKKAEAVLDRAHGAVGAGRLGIGALNQGLENPLVRRFVNS